MAPYLKRGRGADAIAEKDAKVRGIVEGVLADIAKRGHPAVRTMSEKFGSWNWDNYQLTVQDICDCLSASDISALGAGSSFLVNGGWTAQ